MKKNDIKLSFDNSCSFNNYVDSCIGTGRMGLALFKEYQDQLKLCQKEIGFKYIRGHGLFCDDMSIYQERDMTRFGGEVTIDYNFTYLDLVFDFYLSINLKPYLELGFMPYKMASGEQTIFYWKGNTTPPKDYDAWKKLIQVTLRHLIDRYGRDEVITWPVEVWNEPNLPGFWENADMEEYFKLFEVSFNAVKEVDKDFKVGGPAVCGGSDRKWIKAFLEFCKEKNLEPDVITRHHYATELPEYTGHYGYAKLMDPMNEEDGFPGLHSTREIIDSFSEFKGKDIYITEFNTSYIPICPLHDTNQNAAYIANQLSKLGDDNKLYSYWTFGDCFEEMGVPYSLFHGGFGLVTYGNIPKPTFWTFAFFKNLKDNYKTCIQKDDTSIVVIDNENTVKGVCYNMTLERSGNDFINSYEINVKDGNYVLLTKRVDEEVCNPLKVWHDLGENRILKKEDIELIKSASYPQVSTKVIGAVDGKVSFDIELKENAMVYFELKKVSVISDTGYDYNRVLQYK
ncbi:glycosyl hydrolase [Eubacterium sp.]|uniref:GH39 family glycosyl hydrolase n=1 Tax=Eubacterium sp. TaxID=142586 RepID=UPI0025DE62DE|nr:glycosyl hydrolase [Eubacterium sp.]MCR5629328.1 xylan 1,4-beta-xylosidase [Eubacterium sp.]